MSDTRSQLAEIEGLLAAAPDDPALQQLRDDLLQLITLEGQQQITGKVPPSSSGPSDLASNIMTSSQVPSSESVSATNNYYTAQGTFQEHSISFSNSATTIAEAPDLGSFQPVVRNNIAKSPLATKSGGDCDDHDDFDAHTGNTKASSTTATVPNNAATEKKTKKKKKAEEDADAVLDAQFELPSHLVPLESDTPAQRLKKQRTAKALKSKFREKQKEAEHAKRQNEWKSFASKAGGKRRKGVGGGAVGNSSIFSTEDGVNAKVGVISGAGGRTMTNFTDPNKRHK